MGDESVKEQAEKLLKQLELVKTEYVKNRDELSVSIIKDEVAVELKSILDESKDYTSLHSAILFYIEKILKI